ncbi:unnamed protein product [Adineta ricciae]|uniref:PDZ domain-containing protein n=1 Tax=Adineta ricciae TaxID=249248 RepID=A0A814Z8K1_ADIRI|nr:unnamed protein product [Adineta ricciae]CAF1239541.1 unnamed protein product [Adineta ricciae]
MSSVNSHLKENTSSSSSSYQRYYFGPSRLLTKRIHLKSFDGTLDFTITGGNDVQPIQIASVVWASQAYLQGIRPGDQIISVNGISFQQNINYTKALQILYSTNELDIIIRTLRINSLDATLYDWYDPVQQRSTSPPPGSYLSLDSQLPYFERTIRIQVEKGKRLGLVIRGGAEYGLGIFISGVDKGSLSDQGGLCIGDQILSVNGIDFLHITHTDAVQILRNVDEMIFHLRQINKLPKPKEEIQLKSQIPMRTNRIINSKKNFIDQILNENDQILMKKNLKDYLEEKLYLDEFVKSLLEVLHKQNQQFRIEIIDSIRKFVRSNDLDRFDIQILKDDLNTLKLSHERILHQSVTPSRMSMSSPMNHLSKSVENLTDEKNTRLIRPKSLIFNNEMNKPIETEYSPLIERRFQPISNSNSLRKAKSLHNLHQSDQFLLFNKTQRNLNLQQINIIDDFLKDYSSPYPITIHKIRPTLGVAIEGGFQDRIPLPRIVYMQPDGCAYISSGLRVGHVIIGVNGYSMKGLLHREAALFIASTFKDKSSSHMDLLVVQPLNE